MALSKILVVEDEIAIQKIIRMSLKFQGVGEVTVVSNGEECLASVSRERPDLILLDVTMPKLDGYQTCRLLTSDPETRSIPVIFLTAKAQNSEREMGLAAGACGYLIKPFDPMTLLAQIMDILEKEQAPKDQ